MFHIYLRSNTLGGITLLLVNFKGLILEGFFFTRMFRVEKHSRVTILHDSWKVFTRNFKNFGKLLKIRLFSHFEEMKQKIFSWVVVKFKLIPKNSILSCI